MSKRIEKQIENMRENAAKIDMKKLDANTKKVVKETKIVLEMFEDIFNTKKKYKNEELREVRTYFAFFSDHINHFFAKINHVPDISTLNREVENG